MSQGSDRSGDRRNDTEPDTERVRRVRLMQVRLSARRRVAAMQNVTAQTIERTTRYMQVGVIISAACTLITAAAAAYAVFSIKP
jgi:hypothetical protein